MSDAKREARWRQWLTKAEAARIAKIEAAVGAVKPLLAEKQAIANRALQRAKHADRLAAKAPALEAELKRRERKPKG